MCARRFLIAITILTVLAVAAAFAMFQFGQKVLISQATPRGHFTAPAEPGPDYRSVESWLARPGTSGSPVEWLPEGVAQSGPTPAAAVFYIHPTTYLRNDAWTGPVDDPDSSARARLFAQSQASSFASAGVIWAPKYRQAAFGAFLLDSKDAQDALALAYSDVLRAFTQFLGEAGKRPILLAGHSQGALHLTRLLREHVAGKPLARQVVAAYVVGWPISSAADLPALGLPACTAADQAGCLLSWMSFKEPSNPGLVLGSYEGSSGLAGGERRREDMVCVNPLTGTRNGAAPPSANPGTIVPTPDLMSASLAPGTVGARCDDGLLIIDGQVPHMGPYVLPGNNYHVYDYALFWAAIRQDAQRRVAAWQG